MNKVNIPNYFTTKDWKYFSTLEHLSGTEKMVAFISYITETDIEEVKKWKPESLTDIYKILVDKLDDLEPTFFPIFELDGQLYGYAPIGKLTLGEYIDLENLAKQPNENIEEIMAILYRPIKKHKFNSIKWMVKSQLNVAVGKAENLFKYYELEEYNSDDRVANAEKLSVLPASFCLGALSFFLALASISLIGSSPSSINNKKVMKQEMNKAMEGIKEIASMNTGAGLQHLLRYRKVPSLTSREIKLLQI